MLDLTWDYPEEGERAEPSAEAILAEINGYKADGSPVSSFVQLADDGSTSCGIWIYAGCYADGVNQTARRKPQSEQSWVAPEWGWAWPANRRILYNRASADPHGQPWSEEKAYVWWDEAGRGVDRARRAGHREDQAAFVSCRRRGDGAGRAGRGRPVHHAGRWQGGAVRAQGTRRRAAARALRGRRVAGPQPGLQAGRQPGLDRLPGPARDQGQLAGHAATFPYVVTTYRLTEHHTAGAMSRTLGRLAELQPELFCEVSPALAAERGLENGGWATIITARAAIEARVLVTRRNRPLRIPGEGVIHQVGLPYHWGSEGLVTGDSVNDLLPVLLDPNVFIQESKVATCDIRPGRRPRGPGEDGAGAASTGSGRGWTRSGSLSPRSRYEPAEAGHPAGLGGTEHHDQ